MTNRVQLADAEAERQPDDESPQHLCSTLCHALPISARPKYKPMTHKAKNLLLALLVLSATFCAAQTAVLLPEPKIQFLSATGVPLSGGCVQTYAAGTTTPQASFTDSTGGVSNTNPV